MTNPIAATGPPWHYKSVERYARPNRIGMFVNEADDWRERVKGSIEILSRTWGGVTGVIVPVSRSGEVAESIWQLLKMHDPDVVAHYVVDDAHAKIADPLRYEAWVEEGVRGIVKANPGMTDAEARELHQSVARQREMPKNMSATYERIDRELSPYEKTIRPMSRDVTLSSGVDVVATADMRMPDPNKISQSGLGRFTKLTDAYFPVVYDASDYPEDLQLILAAATGLTSATHDEEHKTSANKLKVAKNNVAYVLGTAWSAVAYKRQYDGALLDVTAPRYNNTTPFSYGRSGCWWYSDSFAEEWDKRPFYIVCGDTLDDFSLAHILDRCYASALWMPQVLNPKHGKLRELAFEGLQFAFANWEQSEDPDREVKLVSLSLSESELTEIANELNAPERRYVIGVKVGVASDVDVSQFGEPRFLADLQRSEEQVPFVGNDQAVAFAPMLPTGVEFKSVRRAYWTTEVAIRGWRGPARRQLSNTLSVQGEKGVRSARTGIAYRSLPRALFGETPVEQTAVRATLRTPDASEMFATLLADHGMRRETSDAGRYAAGSASLFGSRDKLLVALRDPVVGRLLNGYLPDSPSEVDPGCYLTPVSRRYLSFANIQQVVVGEVEQVRNAVDELLRLRVVSRGLILQCPRCRYAGWYPLAGVGVSCSCDRCKDEFAIDLETWRMPPDEPTFFYALDEVVYQFLCQHGYVPVFACDALAGDHRLFDHEAGIYFSDNQTRKPNVEIDLWAIIDGRVVIGEAKASTVIADSAQEAEKKVRGWIQVAAALGADELVLATSKSSWSDSALTQLESQAKAAGIRYQVMAGVGAETPFK